MSSHRIAVRFAVSTMAAALLVACQSLETEHPAAAEPVAEDAADAAAPELDRIEVTGSRIRQHSLPAAQLAAAPVKRRAPPSPQASTYWQPANTEKYAGRTDNPVQRASEQPVSTFSIDVDTGSYSNVRSLLAQGMRPPADAVRAEEFINYFRYGHPAPASRETPFRVSTELAPAPWNRERQLLMIGIKGYEMPKASLPPANLVFLIDSSGSMQTPGKLPLLRRAFALLVEQLRPQDTVSIVAYAGSAGLVLPPTPGGRKADILAAIERLEAGGSTNGGEGIRLAYDIARRARIDGGVNRVILATDGDFNVGITDTHALETFVADQREHGIALTTLGFGRDNYNDELSEKLADVGDGNHAYIDSVQEARKVLVEQMGGTLATIAKDVKIQVEFNPAYVAEYRLIGYENRVLAREDFANDKVDAGEIGAGHEVTALYEITPVGSDAGRLPPLRYAANAQPAGPTKEVAHLRLRYKLPEQTRSRLIETPILRSQLAAQPGPRLRFAAAVAAFADLLRGGKRIDGWDWNDVLREVRALRSAELREQQRELAALIERAHGVVAGAPGVEIAAGD